MFLIGFICYDDACHLKRFARDPMRAGITDQGKQLDSVEMVVDKMHMKALKQNALTQLTKKGVHTLNYYL